MSARTAIRDALTTALPSFRVIGAAEPPDRVTRPTVLVFQNTVTPTPQFGLHDVNVEVVAWLLTGYELTEAAEDDLESSLEQLLLALQPLKWTDWTTCERMTFGPPDGAQQHGYKLTLTTHASIGA